LPSLKLLRGIVDRMKSMSQHIILSANHEGELHLAIETDNVTVRTVIRELENPSCRMWPSVNAGLASHMRDIVEFCLEQGDQHHGQRELRRIFFGY
jgi:HUS1 checkpoint protein